MKNIITAHSGAFSTKDNSMEFVKYTLSQGVDALEVDVRLNPEGVLVLSHDELVGADQETLKDVFEQVVAHEGVYINCDLKEEDLERPVYELAMECGLSGRLIFSGTVSGDRFKALNAAENASVFLNIEEYIEDLYEKCKADNSYIEIAISDMCDICKNFDIDCINMNYILATDEAFEIAKKKGIGLSLWTVNEPADIERFVIKGARNITSRTPDVAQKIKDSVGI